MTPLQIHHATDLANQIGKPYRLVCKYEYNRKRGEFCWNFYRRGLMIGSTANLRQVVEKMQRYATTLDDIKNENN